MNSDKTIHLDDVSYPITIGNNLTNVVSKKINELTKDKQIILVFDKNLEDLYASELVNFLETEQFIVQKYPMNGGKTNKEVLQLLEIFTILEKHNFARDSVVIALGGGVVGDLAGFAASTWYRGMHLIHIPTTLIAMVDSSIGGKVAINFKDTINAVGNYYHPSHSFVDLRLLQTLPDREFYSGMAEVLKCALIADEEFFYDIQLNIEQIHNRDFTYIKTMIDKAVDIKVQHVKGDLKEGAERLKLNFGHTLGHAIEMATVRNSEETFRHGEGVSLGISAILEMSRVRSSLSPSHIAEIRKSLETLRLPTSFSASKLGFSRDDLILKCSELVRKDKKRKNGCNRFILLDKIGKSIIINENLDDLVKLCFSSVILD